VVLPEAATFAAFFAEAIGREVWVSESSDVSAIGLLKLASLHVSSEERAIGPKYRQVAPTGSLSDAGRERFAEALRRARNWTTT
jgi:glycerol kinase